jgi:uncharacterized protein (TIGR03437 family)
MKKIGITIPLLFLTSLAAQTVETIPYRALLSGVNENPALSAANKGVATIWLHVVRDASGAIVSGSADAYLNYQFPGAVTITAMHIHNGGPTVNGPVVLGFGIARTDDATGMGAVPPTQTPFPSAAVTLDTVKGIVANPAGFYLNVHTTDAPGGAMRAQLQRAEMYVRMSQMLPDNERPPITGTTWSGVGTSIALITRNARNAINSAYVIFDVKYSGFSDDTAFTGLHIHLGGPAMNGPVTIDSTLRGPVPVPAGGSGILHYEVEANLARAGALDSLNALISNGNAVYMNAHTTAKGGGAIRGALLSTDRTDFQVSLTPANEVPAITGSTAIAAGDLQVFTVRNPDATVAAGVMIFDVNTQFPTGTSVGATHMHDGAAGANGPVTIDSALKSAPILLNDGTGNIYRVVTVAAGQSLASLNDLMINPELHYWNMHTADSPGGLVRAQLGLPVTLAPQITFIEAAVLDVTQMMVAPGSLFTIFGTNLAKVPGSTAGFNNNDTLPTSLNGVSVTVGGRPAPLLYVGPGQINAQAPVDITTVGQPVVVNGINGTSAVAGVGATVYAPVIFADSVGGIAVKKSDNSLIRPTNPATAGDMLLVYATGMGQTTPSMQTGKLVPPSPAFTTAPVTVKIGGVNAPVVSSVALPGYAGLYQVTVMVPSGVTAGNASLQMQMGFFVSNAVGITIQ